MNDRGGANLLPDGLGVMVGVFYGLIGEISSLPHDGKILWVAGEPFIILGVRLLIYLAMRRAYLRQMRETMDEALRLLEGALRDLNLPAEHHRELQQTYHVARVTYLLELGHGNDLFAGLGGR